MCIRDSPLTRERMKTIDDEIVPQALRFMTDAKDADTPFFVWLNTTHMHFRTHLKDGSRGKAGRWQSAYHDAMVDHDELVGEVLTFLDDHGLAEDTIVIYSTDNGPHMNSWPDAGMTPVSYTHLVGPTPCARPTSGPSRWRHTSAAPATERSCTGPTASTLSLIHI